MSVQGAKCLCLITGASRGIGREIAVQLAAHAGPNSAFILTGRDTTALQTVKSMVQNVNSQSTISCLSYDMSNHLQNETGKPSVFETELRQLLKSHGTFDTAIIVHNAGSLGENNKTASQVNDPVEWHRYLQINLISVIELNCTFINVVSANAAKRRLIVNVTSLLAITPMPSFAQYSVGKSAREAYFSVLAQEDATLRVLNYAPGPVETDMMDRVMNNSHSDDIRKSFQVMRDEKKSLTPEQTVKKLVHLVNEDTFQSGAHIDFFDIP